MSAPLHVTLVDGAHDTASVSVAWLSHQRRLGITVLHDTGASFSVIHPCELTDPQRYLVDGCVVMLTGIAFADAPEKLAEHVRALGRAGVAGVGLGVGVAVTEVPPGMVEAAQESGVSLFVVPLETPFIQVLQTVQEELARQRNRSRELLWGAQERLNGAANSGGLELLLKEASASIAAHVLLLDNDGRIAAQAWHGGVPSIGVEEVRRLVREDPLTMATRIGSLTALVHHVGEEGERSHRLIAVSRQVLGPDSRALLRHCAGLAELIVKRPAQYRAIHQELNTLALAIQLGLTKDPGETRMKLFRSAADSRGTIRPALIVAEQPRSLQRVLSGIDDALEQVGRLLFAIRIDPRMAFAVFRGDRSAAEVYELMAASHGSARIAIGNTVSWRELSMEVIRQLERMVLRTRPGEWVGPSARGVDWMLEAPVREALSRRVHETWGRLAAHDSELERTLEAFLRHMGNISHTASELQIHRHTVSKRVRLIEEVLEVDLDDPVTRAELLVVAQAR